MSDSLSFNRVRRVGASREHPDCKIMHSILLNAVEKLENRVNELTLELQTLKNRELNFVLEFNPNLGIHSQSRE
jgi:hypothetical protein